MDYVQEMFTEAVISEEATSFSGRFIVDFDAWPYLQRISFHP